MDPLTCAARAFAQELRDGWEGGAAVALVAAEEQRGRLLQALRLFEWAPENRWPLAVIEAKAEDLEGLAEVACGSVLAAFAELRRGLAADGVEVGVPELTETRGPASERLWQIVDGCGAALARTGVVEGLALVFVPPEPLKAAARQRLAKALEGWPGRRHVRLAMATPEASALGELLPVRAELRVDERELLAYCQVQGERAAAGGPAAEAGLRRAMLAAHEAAKQGDLPRTRAAYVAAQEELEGQGRHEEAAIVSLALGGICFALGDLHEALVSFERVAEERSGGVAAMGALGAAGVHYAQGELGEAALRYEEAGAQGETAGLQVEAWWMAGICHAGGGAREAAASAWEVAFAVGLKASAEVREKGSWRRAGEALQTYWCEIGRAERAAEVRAALAREGVR